MLDDAARSPRGYAPISFLHRGHDDHNDSNMARAFYRDSSRDDFESPSDRRRSRPHHQHTQYLQENHQHQQPHHHRRMPRSSPSPTSSGSGSGSSAFSGRDYFKCPELDQRMKKYLVRLANETANHLIRDTLEPEHANLVWKPMTSTKGIEILRGSERVHDSANNSNDSSNSSNNPENANNANKSMPTRDSTCLRGVAQVNASIEEFAMLFKLDTNKRLAEHGLLFNPDLLDMTTLYSLVQPSGDQPRRYVGIKWCLMQSPSRIFRNRDFCYLECQKEFRDARGRRGWVRSMHSIKMPCCPTLEKSHSIVRASLYRCGLIAVETDKPGVLDTTYTIEMDLKGHFPELFQPKFLSQRIAALASIDKYLQQQRLSSSPLLGDLDIPASKVKGTCHFCFREFAKFTRRYVCRKCGEGVCKYCSDDWHLDIPVIGRKKVRICTVCSAESRYCHSTPLTARDTYSGGGLTTPENALDEGAYRRPQARHMRRSQSTPSHFDFGNIPEPSPSMYNGSISSRTTYEQSPSEYFAAQLQQSHQPQYERTSSRRESEALYRESDFATNFGDLHGGIRGTADLTGLWTEEDAGPFHQARGESTAARRESRAVPMRRGTMTPEPQRASHRSRAPTFATDPSSYDQDNDENSAFNQNNGHFPPSSRYMVVDNRLERVNSYDAARKLEEQRRRQQQPQYQDQQRHTAYYGNSRRSPQSLVDGFQPHHRGRHHSTASTSHYRYPSPDSTSSPRSQYASDNERRRTIQQQPQPRSSANYRPSRGTPASSVLSSSPAPSPAPRNIALEFLAKNQKQPAPRNIAMEFAANKQQQPAAPQNIAMAFAAKNQQQRQHEQPPQPAPRNIAMEFLANIQQPAQKKASPFGSNQLPKAPMFQFGSATPKRGAYQPEPLPSPELPIEPVEYIESESGEWIASDRWEKGVLNRSFLDLDDGQLALETQSCETCGAKQYVHDGVIEATTCDCVVDEDLMKPSTLSGQPTRDESRSSFYGGGLYDGDFVLGERQSLNEPSFSDLNGYSRRSSTMEDSGDIDAVIPLLVERLSQHSLRSSFQN